MRRRRRRGFLERQIFPMLGKFPWLCRDCGTAFRAQSRGLGEDELRRSKALKPRQRPAPRRAPVPHHG